MRTVTVDLGDRSYPIFIGSGLISDNRFLARHIRAQQVMVVSNDRIAPLYLEHLTRALDDRQLATVILPDGEQHKRLETFATIIDSLIEHSFHRDCCVVALGGGVVGDVAGFAAASYQRGVDFVQIPTTLLAQVDSSVGGKTAVNHPQGKNMIGAFYQPQAVIADIATLSSLADRELKAGLAEVIKYGLIMDAEFFAWLEASLDDLLAGEESALIHAVETSCRSKAQVVAEDETESGRRAILNLGHTFGHGIETLSGYGTILHGEAVAIGMCLAARMSVATGGLSQPDCSRIEALIHRAGLPTRPTHIDPGSLIQTMGLDKKVRDGRMRLVLLDEIGCANITDNVDKVALLDVVADACGKK